MSFAAAGLRMSVWTIGTFALLAAPLVFDVGRTISDGDYVSQRYFWRNAPPGIDLATLVLGNPFHGAWGSMVPRVRERLGIDVVESTAWLGLAPVILMIYALRHGAADTAVRQWRLVAIVFFVWALGSHLFIVGHNTAVPGPAALLQFVPVLSNARMTRPGDGARITSARRSSRPSPLRNSIGAFASLRCRRSSLCRHRRIHGGAFSDDGLRLFVHLRRAARTAGAGCGRRASTLGSGDG
jgi:hypothetical protein